MTERMQLGLVGLGRFGRFAAAHLRREFEIVAADACDVSAACAELGIRHGAVAEAAASPVVLLAVPIQALRPALQEIAPHVAPDALVADVCSVKVEPLRWMRELLPDHVELLGTHPMFGPESASAGLQGQVIVLCPERTTHMAQACALMERLGLEVIVADADTHDRQVAYTQALAQYLGRVVRDLEGAAFPITTPAARRLREVARTVGSDSWELFAAIQEVNPYALAMRKDVRRRLAEIDRRLATGPAE